MQNVSQNQTSQSDSQSSQQQQQQQQTSQHLLVPQQQSNNSRSNSPSPSVQNTVLSLEKLALSDNDSHNNSTTRSSTQTTYRPLNSSLNTQPILSTSIPLTSSNYSQQPNYLMNNMGMNMSNVTPLPVTMSLNPMGMNMMTQISQPQEDESVEQQQTNMAQYYYMNMNMNMSNPLNMYPTQTTQHFMTQPWPNNINMGQQNSQRSMGHCTSSLFFFSFLPLVRVS
jgi:hypothetical protein